MRASRAVGFRLRVVVVVVGIVGLAAVPRAAAATMAAEIPPPEPPIAATPAPAPAPAAPAPAAATPAPAAATPAPLPASTPLEMPAPRPISPALEPSRTAPSSAAPRSSIHEAAPRPEAAIRVQQRFAVKAKLTEIYGGFEYLSRGDFYNSPGLRVGAVYYLLEQLGLEAQLAYDWSSLNATAEQVKMTYGLLPDSHPPGLRVVGRRALLDRLRQGGGGRVRGRVHFEPQAFVHAGIHDNGGEVGPSGDVGLAFLVFLLPRVFVRADVAVTLDAESRSGTTIGVWGALPALSVGGLL